jgi:cell division septation protein DedD
MKRERRGGGLFQRLGLVLAALVILTLTFTLGVLVGRQWGARPSQLVVAEAPRKPVGLTRRGLGEVEADRPRDIQEKLTFYQTLTAPLGPTGQSGRARSEERSRPQTSPTASPPASAPPTAPTAPAAPAVSAVPAGATPASSAASAAGVAGAASPSAWSVQVGAFKSRQQADGVQKRLTDAGFPAVLSTVALDDGQPRYRVRVGGVRSRGEAEQLAQQVRARLPLATLVTAD